MSPEAKRARQLPVRTGPEAADRVRAAVAPEDEEWERLMATLEERHQAFMEKVRERQRTGRLV